MTHTHGMNRVLCNINIFASLASTRKAVLVKFCCIIKTCSRPIAALLIILFGIPSPVSAGGDVLLSLLTYYKTSFGIVNHASKPYQLSRNGSRTFDHVSSGPNSIALCIIAAIAKPHKLLDSKDEWW